jgi:hypothetical protein
MSRNLLLFLGLVAVSGGAFYLYKSGKLVGMPGQMSQGTPMQEFKLAKRLPIPMPTLSGYYW